MSLSVIIDWKFVLALGAAASGVILSLKTDSEKAGQVLTHVADACKENAAAA